MKIPGTTMSPRPNIAKLLAEIPFSKKSWGNTTIKIPIFYGEFLDEKKNEKYIIYIYY